LTLVFLALVAAAYVVDAWYVAQRVGQCALLLTWLGADVLFAAYRPFQVHRRQAALGFRPEQQHSAAFFFSALAIGVPCFGAATQRFAGASGPGAPQLGGLWARSLG
jgi:hypothetical protein